jgi:hypothetical protein
VPARPAHAVNEVHERAQIVRDGPHVIETASPKRRSG